MSGLGFPTYLMGSALGIYALPIIPDSGAAHEDRSLNAYGLACRHCGITFGITARQKFRSTKVSLPAVLEAIGLVARLCVEVEKGQKPGGDPRHDGGDEPRVL